MRSCLDRRGVAVLVLVLDLVDVKFLVIQWVLHGGFLPFRPEDEDEDDDDDDDEDEPSILSVAFHLYRSSNPVA